MKTISIDLDDRKADLLKKKAALFGLSVQDFVNAAFDDLLAKPDDDFSDAMEYILKKNKDLYKKLS